MIPIPPKHRKEKVDPAKGYRVSCAFCMTAISPPVIYFCRACWALLPALERAGLYQLHHHNQPTASKVERCVRILRKKQQPTKNENETDQNKGDQL